MFLLRSIQLSTAAGILLGLADLSPAQGTATKDPAAAAGLGITAMFPKADAKDVCPDTPLRLTFSGPPIVGAGKIHVFDAEGDVLIEAIDVAEPTKIKTIGGFPNFKYYPILIDGNEAAIYLPGALGYGKTYYVKIDAGGFKDSAGDGFAGLGDVKSWRFTTKSRPPEATTKKLVVAADGSGDFASVQGAIDFIPEGNTDPRTIFIKNGTYNELICFTGRNNLTFQGEDRKKTIIAYANNSNFNNNAGANPFAPGATPTTATRRSGAVYHRGLFLAHRVTDLTIEDLTLHNTTPQGGSQAEAIILNGRPDARAVLRDLDLYSFQDTLQVNGQAYISNCYIEGDVDFLWGTGPCFFEYCYAKSLRSNAYYTQIRNPPTNHGYIFKRCTFDGSPGITGNFLSRIEPTRFPASEVVLIDCVLTDAVGPVAWRLDRAMEAPDVHFWEFNSRTPDGQPVDTSKRPAFSKQLKLPEDQETVDNYSNPTWVLGGDWTPK